MKVTTTRTVHIELSGQEANELADTLHSVLNILTRNEKDFPSMKDYGHTERLLKLKTELVNAPR